MYESYVPLLPLPDPAISLLFANALPRTCSISAIRGGFIPIPLRLQETEQRKPRGYKKLRSEEEQDSLNKPKDTKVDRVKHGADRVPVPTASPDLGGSFSHQPLVIREMKRADVESVKHLQDSHLPLVYPPSFYTFLLTTSDFLCLLAYSSSALVGSVPQLLAVASARLLTPSSIYLLSLVVDPPSRRTGVARTLLQELCQRITGKKDVTTQLHVQWSNAAARLFYKKVGLSEVAVAKGHYRGLGDAIEMRGKLCY